MRDVIYWIYRKKEGVNLRFRGMKGRIVFSQILTWLLILGLVVLAIVLPWIMRAYVENFAYPDSAVVDAKFGAVLALGYCVLVPAFAAGGLMLWLLRRVKRGLIFVSPSAMVIQLIAICCFAECAIFVLFSMYFLVALAIAFAALFLGIALLVVSDVVSVGTEIKTENDYTV